MSGIIQMPWRTQPHTQPPVLPRYLGSTWIPGGQPLVIGGGTPVIGPNGMGRGLIGDGLSWLTYPSKTYASDAGITVVFVAGNVGATSTNSMLCGDVSTANFIWLNDGSGVLRLRQNSSDTFFTVDTTKMAAYVLTVEAAVATTHKNKSLYKNGVLVSTQNGPIDAFPLTMIGNGYTSNTFALNGGVNLLHVMPIFLPESEAVALSKNPWQIFVPPRRTL